MEKDFMVPAISKKEALEMANILDELGMFEDASLLDSYAEQYSDDLIKTAGIWSDIWEKMKGGAKKLLFKKYKQLYDVAKKVQERAQERMNLLNDKFKQMSKALKTYQMESWATTMNEFSAIGGQELLQEEQFAQRYSDYTNAFYKNVPSEEYNEFGGNINTKDETDWTWYSHVSRSEPRIQKHYKQNDVVRIDQELWERWKKHLKLHFSDVDNNNDKQLIGINFDVKKYKERLPANMKETFENYLWERIPPMGDRNFVYLKRVATINPETKEQTDLETELEVPKEIREMGEMGDVIEPQNKKKQKQIDKEKRRKFLEKLQQTKMMPSMEGDIPAKLTSRTLLQQNDPDYQEFEEAAEELFPSPKDKPEWLKQQEEEKRQEKEKMLKEREELAELAKKNPLKNENIFVKMKSGEMRVLKYPYYLKLKQTKSDEIEDAITETNLRKRFNDNDEFQEFLNRLNETKESQKKAQRRRALQEIIKK